MNTDALRKCLPETGAGKRRVPSKRTTTVRFYVFSLDELMRKIEDRRFDGTSTFRDVCIFNCCPSTSIGIHWMVLLLENIPNARVGTGLRLMYQFFDSYAQDIRLYSSVLADCLVNVPCLWQNEKRVQAYASTTCGAHCLLFVWAYRKLQLQSGEHAIVYVYSRQSLAECEMQAERMREKCFSRV